MAAPFCLARQIPVCTVRRADKCPYVVLRVYKHFIFSVIIFVLWSKGSTVFCRLDFNVPTQENHV